VQGLVILAVTLAAFVGEVQADGTVSHRDLSVTFATFVVATLVNAYSCRSEVRSAFMLSPVSNSFFLVACSLSVLLLVVIIHVPGVQDVFETESLSLLDWGRVLLAAVPVLAADEVTKLILAAQSCRTNRTNTSVAFFLVRIRELVGWRRTRQPDDEFEPRDDPNAPEDAPLLV
jgi:magnesium-transporting ATPase (P-type)